MAKTVLAIPVFLAIFASCSRNQTDSVAKLTQEFVYTTLSFSPVTATGVGLHEYENKKLDSLLDDLSPSALDAQKKFYDKFQAQLKALDPSKLDAESKADLDILQDQTSLALLELNEVQSPLHSPTLYVETLGNALFSPFVLEYAPLPARMQSIISRLEKVPVFLDQASTNLQSSPEIWTQVAMDENQGNIDLVDKTLRAAVPENLRDSYARAASPALDAMRKFQDYLKSNLMLRSRADWRLGKDRYVRKFRWTLDCGMDADAALAAAESDLTAVRKRMYDMALARSGKPAAAPAGEAQQNQVIGEALAKIAENHSTPQSYMDDARKDLEEARAFVQAKNLLTLPAHANLQVIPTPEFMRGIYAVGGFNSAPALEPQLGAFYWVTPIPPSWPKERVESKLREYNFYKLKLLTIHEAVPGHYVQMEFANNVQPPTRRLLRSVFGNGPYIEGWAQYATESMLDEGFLDHSRDLALTFAKEELRVLANLILDVRLQMLGMTDQEALDLMMKQTFQEKEEAEAKLQRAKLSSAQLPMYYVGWRAWKKVREQYRQSKGDSFRLAAFHDAALKEGAVPLTVLGGLLK